MTGREATAFGGTLGPGPLPRAPAVVRVAAGLVLLCLAPTRLLGQDIDLKDFTRTYAAATEKLAAYYDNVGMRIRYSRRVESFRPDQFPGAEESNTYDYKASGGRFLLRTTPGKGGGPRQTRLLLVNSAGGVLLEKSARSERYDLTDVYNEDYAESCAAVRRRAVAPHASFTCYGEKLLDLFNDPAIKVRKVRKVGGRYVVEYEFAGPLGNAIPSRAVFDADRSLALVEHTRGARSRWKQSVRYQGTSNGVPLVQRVEIIHKDETGVAKEVWEVEDYLPGPFPEGDFSLARYMTRERGSKSRPPLWFYLLLALLASLTLAVLCRVLRRALRRSVEEDGVG